MIMAATLLLISDTPEAIQYSQVIPDFIILAQNILYDDKTFYYIEHALYRLKNTKIVFEHHLPINCKLCSPTFNYPKFYVISYLVQSIWDYNNIANYNIAHSKAAYKYLLQVFYNGINKIEYNAQIWQHNVHHTNIIVIKDVIISEKNREEKILLEDITNIIMPAEVSQVSNPVNLAGKLN